MENFDDTNTFLSEEKLPKGVPFTTPEDYFDSLRTVIENRVAIKDFESKSNSFEVPANYFENLTQHIENKIAQKEFENINDDDFFVDQKETILNTIALSEKITTDQPFEVPSDYFENLTSAIEAKTSLKQKPAILKFTAYKWAYAAAAAIILAFGVVYFGNNKPNEIITANDIKEINADSLSTAEIVSALRKSDISEEELIKHIDTKEITIELKIEEKDLKSIIDELDETDLTNAM